MDRNKNFSNPYTQLYLNSSGWATLEVWQWTPSFGQRATAGSERSWIPYYNEKPRLTHYRHTCGSTRTQATSSTDTISATARPPATQRVGYAGLRHGQQPVQHPTPPAVGPGVVLLALRRKHLEDGPLRGPSFFLCAKHDQQLEGGSSLPNRTEVNGWRSARTRSQGILQR